MKKRIRITAALLIILVSAGSLAGCAKGSKPKITVEPDELTKIKSTVREIRDYLETGVQFAEDAQLGKLLSPESAAALRSGFTDVLNFVKTVDDRLQTYTKFDAASREDLSKLFADVVSGIKRLNELGTLHIKNEVSWERFNRVMSLVKAVASLVEKRLKNES